MKCKEFLIEKYNTSGERYELRNLFDAYMRFEGMPGIADIGLDKEKALIFGMVPEVNVEYGNN